MLISILVPFHSFIIIIIRFLNFISKSTVLYCILHLSNPISALLERKKKTKHPQFTVPIQKIRRVRARSGENKE